MRNEDLQRERYRSLISDGQRRATELSIELKLEAQDSDDVEVLAQAAENLDTAIEELEKARRVLVAA